MYNDDDQVFLEMAHQISLSKIMNRKGWLSIPKD